ncbi:MAG: helix-turn-helix domain-containing protein [Methylobacter sp.]|nr:helix-turn-helix domain-containing protein [Methylobacter sp.]
MWPGNVRELQNVIERAVILSQGTLLDIAPQPTRAHPEAAMGKLRTLEAVEREHITRTLEATRWQISGAKGVAAILGMSPNTLRSRMLKLGVSRAS